MSLMSLENLEGNIVSEIIVCPKGKGDKNWFVYHLAETKLIDSSLDGMAGQKAPLQVVVGKGQTAFLVTEGMVRVRLSSGIYELSAASIPELSVATSGRVSVDIYFVNDNARLSMYFGTSTRPVSVVDPVCGEKYRLQMFGKFSLSLSLSYGSISVVQLDQLSDFQSVLVFCRNLIDGKLPEYVQRAVDECHMDVSIFSSATLSDCIQRMFGRDLTSHGLSLDLFLLDTVWINDDDMVRCLAASHVQTDPKSSHSENRQALSSGGGVRFCPYCGRELPPSTHFCPYCGKNCFVLS